MDLQLNGKVALITGASRGLGKACAEMLASEGCHLSLCGRNKAKLEEVANGLRSDTVKVLTVEADLRKREENEKFVNDSVAHFGGMDILINNAGAGQLSDLLSHDEGVIRENGPDVLWSFAHFQSCDSAFKDKRWRKNHQYLFHFW